MLNSQESPLTLRGFFVTGIVGDDSKCDSTGRIVSVIILVEQCDSTGRIVSVIILVE